MSHATAAPCPKPPCPKPPSQIIPQHAPRNCNLPFPNLFGQNSNPTPTTNPSQRPNSHLQRPTNHQVKPPVQIPPQHNHPQCNVLYFEGFPSDWTVQHLNQIFCQFNAYGLISIAKKRNIRNLRFGFLRVHQDLNVLGVINRINKIHTGASKLKASFARFPTKPKRTHPQQTNPQPSIPKQTHPTHPKPIRLQSLRDSRTYKEITTSGSVHHAQPSLNSHSEETSFRYTGPIHPTPWATKSCVLSLKDIKQLFTLKTIFEENGVQFDTVAPLGGEHALLTFLSDEELSAFIHSKKDYLKEVVKDILPFESCPTPTERLTWLELFGLPPKFLTSDILAFIISRFGKFVCFHEDFLSMKRMDVVTVLVSIRGETRVQGHYTTQIGQEKINLHVSETNADFSSHEIISDSSTSSGESIDQPSTSFNPIPETNYQPSTSSNPTLETNHVVSSPIPQEPTTEPSPSPLTQTINILSNPSVDITGKDICYVNSSRPGQKTKRILSNGDLATSQTLKTRSTGSRTDIEIRNTIIKKQGAVENNNLSPQEEAMASWMVGKAIGVFNEEGKDDAVAHLEEMIRTA